MTKAIFTGYVTDTINSNDAYMPGIMSVDPVTKAIIIYDGKTVGGIALTTAGKDGAQGLQGIQGLPGKDGVNGTNGKDGLPGAKGDTGPQGVQGPAGVGIKGFASGYVDAGQFVTLDNLKFTVTGATPRGLSCATVSGTVALSIAATYSTTGGGNGHSTSWPQPVYTTTPSGSWFGYHFPNAGDGSTYLINDTVNQRVYRVHLLIGYGYLKNFISIERLI